MKKKEVVGRRKPKQHRSVSRKGAKKKTTVKRVSKKVKSKKQIKKKVVKPITYTKSVRKRKPIAKKTRTSPKKPKKSDFTFTKFLEGIGWAFFIAIILFVLTLFIQSEKLRTLIFDLGNLSLLYLVVFVLLAILAYVLRKKINFRRPRKKVKKKVTKPKIKKKVVPKVSKEKKGKSFFFKLFHRKKKDKSKLISKVSKKEVKKEVKKKGKVEKLTISPKIKIGTYQTGIDILYKMIVDNGKIRIDKVVKEFGTKKELIEGWAAVLESHELITIRYPAFGSPILIRKEEKKEEEENLS